jgi:predicted RecB family nuclease
METINKTIFMKVHQCSKAAYLYVKHPELRSDDKHLESLFRKGNEVDKEARKLFPLGIDVTEGGYRPFSEHVQYTDSLIAEGIRILYQPCFQHENLRCKADILVTGEKVWKIYEVKSGTSLTDEYIIDAAYQTKVIKDCYPSIKLETYVVYINKDYVRGKE